MSKTPVIDTMTTPQNQNELHINTTDGRIKLEVINDAVIRVVYTKRDQFSCRESLMMVPRLRRKVHWTTKDEETDLVLSTPSLQLVICKSTGSFTWLDNLGHLLVREPLYGGKMLEEIPVEVTVFDPFSKVKTVDSVDGARIQTEGGQKQLDRMAYSSKLKLIFSEGEAIYGLGQHEEGLLNYRGHQQILYQHNMKLAVPMFVSTLGYAILWDTYSLSVFHDDAHGSYFWSEMDDEMDFYFIYGPEFDQIISEYRTLTGQLPMLPKWAYGYVQSKERYVDSRRH